MFSHFTRFLLVFAAAGVLMSSQAMAHETELHQRALAAGFKAAFICSGTFNGNKMLPQIQRDELSRTVPEIQDILPSLPEAEINWEGSYVSVAYDENMPPRISAWREHLGCAQLPIGATAEDIEILPVIELEKPELNPEANWPVGNPLDFSEPNPALQEVLTAAFDRSTYGEGTETTAILITTPDQIIAEKYRYDFTPDTSQRTWSVAKSVAATVIGAAVHQGILNLEDPAPVPEWQAEGDPRGEITLENLLHMSSGLYSGIRGNRTSDIYFGGSRVTDRATEHPLEARPGERWKYANNDTMVAIRALRHALGDDQRYLKFPFQELLYKIGMTRTNPETDWEGNFIFSSQVWTTARDLARLGILYLNNGIWEGERILPDWWAEYVAAPSPDQPPLNRDDGSIIAGYGAQFWLFNDRFENTPDDTYAAQGHRGQKIIIIPSRDLVIVRRGYDESGGARFETAKFIADVLAALEDE